MRVVFLGIPDFAKPIVDELTKHFKLADSLNEADLAVVAAYGRILTKDELNTPKFGCINVHPSLLPKYRGPSPIQAAILNGEKKSGITIIKMDEEVDHGPILVQVEEKILPNDTAETLYERLFKIGAKLLPQTINQYLKGQIKLSPQDDSKATFTKILTRKDGFFDIKNPPSPEILDRMIRAYYPWPGVWTRAIINNKPSIVKFLPEKKIQVEGKRAMTYKDFINGYPQAKEVLSFALKS